MDRNFLSKRKRDSTDDSSQISSLEVLKRLKPNINPTYIEAARRILEAKNENKNEYSYIDNKVKSPFKDITNTSQFKFSKIKPQFSMIPKAASKSRIASSNQSAQSKQNQQNCTDLIVSLNSIAYLAAKNHIDNFFQIVHTQSMNQLLEEQLDEFIF